jgi:hypothetical protein
MTRSLRGAWGRKDTPRDEKALRDNAEKSVQERDAVSLKRLQELQGKEMKNLETEKAFLAESQARDPKPEHDREIAGLNMRFDRRVRELERRHNGFWGKVHRIVGGHGHQQRQIKRIERQRAKEVGEREGVQAVREGQRQKMLAERVGRVDKDIREAKERHAKALDDFRKQRERGFEMAVRQEMTRQRSRSRGRSL